MPIVKVTLESQTKSVLVAAGDLDSLKSKVEKKYGTKVEKFVRSEDKFEIDDDEVFLELVKQNPELHLIAVESRNSLRSSTKKSIKIWTISSEKPANIVATDLNTLIEKSENEFGIEIEKFVRKSDGTEIDDDEVLAELLETDTDLWLIALTENEEYDPSLFRFEKVFESSLSLKKSTSSSSPSRNSDDIDYEKEFEEMENNIKSLKTETGLRSKSLNDITTKEFEKKKKELEEKKKKLEEEKIKKEKRISELKTLSTSVIEAKENIKKLDNQYKEKLLKTEATREITKTELAKAEERWAKLDLQKKRISNIFYELKQAEKVDICFLVDCTGSMDSYITETKLVIHKIVDKLKTLYADFKLRVAFVGYRDHSDGNDRVTVFPFNSDIDAFKSFVSSVKATGGDDQCEDVFGGLEEVTKLEWTHMSRILFHVADAPCHGSRFHIDAYDSYPSGDPRGLNITSLLTKLVNLNTAFYFAEINECTRKMIEEFDKELVANQGNKINVVSLATADGLTALVTKSIVDTISKSKTASMNLTKGKTTKTVFLDTSPINWSLSLMKKYKAIYYTAKFDGTLNEISKKPVDFTSKECEVWIAPKPFSKGAMRFAYAANLFSNKYVLKESMFKDFEYNSEKYHKDLIENQVIASFLAKLFFDTLNSKGFAEKRVSFIDVGLVYLNSDGKYYSAEEYIEGEFKKWISNAGILDEDIYSCTLDAFSHWTYQATDEYLIVTDLQGMERKSSSGKMEYVLTDPAITCPDNPERFTGTNLAIKGVKKFFENHQCNHICKILKLKKHKYQAKPDREIRTLATAFRG